MTRHKPLTACQLAELRGQIQLDSGRIAEIGDRQRKLRAELSELAGELREVTNRRDAQLQDARRNGVTAEELAADTGLTAGRIRQIAPGRPAAPRGRRPGAAPAARRRTEVTVTVDDAEPAEAAPVDVHQLADAQLLALADAQLLELARGGRLDVETLVDQATAAGLVDQAAPPAPAAGWITPAAPESPLAPPKRPVVKRPPVGGKARLPKAAGAWTIAGRVDQALQLAAGDMEAAGELLANSAVEDVMSLLDQARAGARYDYTAHPALPAPLIRPGRKQADAIWEARPHWRNPTTPAGTVVDVLDVNGAYLAALRRVHLPIGKLVQDDDPTIYDPKRAGIYLVDPPSWVAQDAPNPLGEGRTESGPMWITTPTLRLFMRAAPGFPLRILESWTSGASESLLTKFGDTLAAARMAAIEAGDDVTKHYVQDLYSRFVSTAGDSAANRDIRRPEWVHAIRSQAFANLWLKGARAATCRLHVHAILGTDELHVAGDWRSALWNGRPAFPEGRSLSTIKFKRSYVVGERGEEVKAHG